MTQNLTSVDDEKTKGIPVPSLRELYATYKYNYTMGPNEPKPIEGPKFVMSDEIKQAVATASKEVAHHAAGRMKLVPFGDYLIKIWSMKDSKTNRPIFTIQVIDQKYSSSDNTHQCLADFFCFVDEKDGNWKMHHRQVSPLYRGRGLGGEMMSIMEMCAKENGAAHLLIDIPQMDIVTFANSKGYVPKTSKDAALLQSVLEEPEKYFLMTAKGYGGVKRPGFIFEKATIRRRLLSDRHGFAMFMTGNDDSESYEFNGDQEAFVSGLSDDELRRAVDVLCYGDPEGYEKLVVVIDFVKKL